MRRRAAQGLVLLLQQPGPTPQFLQLSRLRGGHTRTTSFLDLGLGQPVPQTRLADPEVSGDVRDRRIALSGDRPDIVAELIAVGLGMVNIRPAVPRGTTDQMSPIYAADPLPQLISGLSPRGHAPIRLASI